MVADLVHAHHGRPGPGQHPGRGSTFTVTVPLLVDSGAAPTGRPAPPRIPRSRPTGATRRLLLVEDDTDLREFLTRLLTADGWAVRAVADAETALAS